LYDIIPIEYPELVGDDSSLSFSGWLTTVVKTANAIYVSATEVRDQIVRGALLSGREIKARIVPIAFGHSRLEGGFSGPPIAPDARTAKVDIGNFVLSVGTIDVRKNQALLCRIWNELADSFGADNIPQLVLVGRDDIDIASADPTASCLFVADRIVALNGLTDGQVAALYKACLFTAFPSLAEGYGLPVAESLQYGKLCISSSLAPVRERTGDLAWYFRPDDFDGALALFLRAIGTASRSRENGDAHCTRVPTAQMGRHISDNGRGGAGSFARACSDV
jgi:glycosyltransferase involved in cell wall biosynthesis